MSNSYQTPGIYIVEKSAFPNSVVAVQTAVPVFIGYTEKALNGDRSISGRPFRISSLTDYENLFGKGFRHVFAIEGHTKTLDHPVQTITNLTECKYKLTTPRYFLYDCMKWYFINGGGDCYILSLGEYANNHPVPIDCDDIQKLDVFAQLEKEQEPTLIVMPDFLQPAERDKCYALYKDVLKHCFKTKSRMGIFDLIPGENESLQDTLGAFRNAIGLEGLSYGAAYYPWLHTSVITESEIDFTNLDLSVEDLPKLLPEPIVGSVYLNSKQPLESDSDDVKLKKIESLHNEFIQTSATYKKIISDLINILNLLPPSSAMAGIYTLVDQSRGVWKSPANVSVTAAISPSVQISSQDQEGMNVDAINGKSVNAIRHFIGQGLLVWGARTLDGNNSDWKYINVRRTVIMIEQSVMQAMKAYVFEANDSNTWVSVKSMINNFLNHLWKQGGLMGNKPDDAFAVAIGLRDTMTAEDVLSGRMLVSISVAITRPSEFIVLTIDQQQQKSG